MHLSLAPVVMNEESPGVHGTNIAGLLNARCPPRTFRHGSSPVSLLESLLSSPSSSFFQAVGAHRITLVI